MIWVFQFSGIVNCVTKSLNFSHYLCLCLCIGIMRWSSVYNALLTRQVYLWAFCSPSGIEPMSLLHWVSEWQHLAARDLKIQNERNWMQNKKCFHNKEWVAPVAASDWRLTRGAPFYPLSTPQKFHIVPTSLFKSCPSAIPVTEHQMWWEEG